MNPKILLITPPFTQLNTPYPATAYLKGFLNTQKIDSFQADLGIDVILKLFSRSGLEQLLSGIDSEQEISYNSQRILALWDEYLQTIEPVISFLQNKNPSLAHLIADRNYLPEASRFSELEDLDWAFGSMGLQDKARHFATLYLEDLADFVKELEDPFFGFSRYAERLGRSAASFDELHSELEKPDRLLSRLLKNQLDVYIRQEKPDVLCISVPFPGNLFGALKCGQFVKANHPQIKIVVGGGFANTELRKVSDVRVFNYLDFICLDDGERPLLTLLEFLQGNKKQTDLKRTFALEEGEIKFWDGSKEKDIAQRNTGTPDYRDLRLGDYLSVIEIVNPMHRLWSDGRWIKLTLAHGCYWGKCTFCDISLDYIRNYQPIQAKMLCDRIEELIQQTGQNGFHFVDEAAPPALMRDLALEIIRRGLTVVWWTNIRFEKSFHFDLCRLLKASGCIAVSGGLEVASDRLLDLMKKGVSVGQVACITDNFTRAGIMVHAYLMYGFPSQTAQESIDSLEMVRQLFAAGVIQSGFWHRFAMTAHSPVGLDPASFGVQRTGPEFAGFAENDLFHEDPQGAVHEQFSEGLKKSLYNFMHGLGFDFPLQDWFDFGIPTTSISHDYIQSSIDLTIESEERSNARLLWLGGNLILEELEDEGESFAAIEVLSKKSSWDFETSLDLGLWLRENLQKAKPGKNKPMTLKKFKAEFESFGEWDDLRESEIWEGLAEMGLLVV